MQQKHWHILTGNCSSAKGRALHGSTGQAGPAAAACDHSTSKSWQGQKAMLCVLHAGSAL
jgi:hypothetical protein